MYLKEELWTFFGVKERKDQTTEWIVVKLRRRPDMS